MLNFSPVSTVNWRYEELAYLELPHQTCVCCLYCFENLYVEPFCYTKASADYIFITKASWYAGWTVDWVWYRLPPHCLLQTQTDEDLSYTVHVKSNKINGKNFKSVCECWVLNDLAEICWRIWNESLKLKKRRTLAKCSKVQNASS